MLQFSQNASKIHFMGNEKRHRLGFHISEVQKQRMEELCNLHGHSNITQCAKFLMQRGLTIECSASGIITTNDKLTEMMDIMSTELGATDGGSCSTATGSHFRDNTIKLDLD